MGNRSLAWWTLRYVCILLQVLCTLGTEKAVQSGGKGEVGGRSDSQYRVSSSPKGGFCTTWPQAMWGDGHQEDPYFLPLRM